jgi:hypothetical protein
MRAERAGGRDHVRWVVVGVGAGRGGGGGAWGKRAGEESVGEGVGAGGGGWELFVRGAEFGVLDGAEV